jgi:hypothetical protein
MAGLGRSKLMLGGIRPCSMASTVLITPTTPEAWLRWPMLDFTEPMPHQPRSSVLRR